MTSAKLVLRAALLLGWLVAGQTTFAQPPTGSITNTITAATNSIWDVSLMFPDLTTNSWGGSFALFAIRATNDAVEVSLTNACALDGGGHLRGSGTNDLFISRLALAGEIGTNQAFRTQTNLGVVSTVLVPQVVTNYSWTDFQDIGPVLATYVTTGSITGSKGNAIFRFLNRSFGEIPFDGVIRRISTTKAYWVTIPANGSSLGGSSGNLIALTGKRQYGTGGIFNNFNPFSRILGGGFWTLVLNFDPPSAANLNALTGNANVTLSSQAVYPFHFTGRYIPTTQQSPLLLTGVKGDGTNTFDGRGATLSLTLGTNGTLVHMLGRICGQSILQR